MATVDDESIARKLQSVSNAQDSIQSLSLWIIHHKNQHKRIVELWLKVLRKAKVNHRLTLFYLCNDVVQNCKRKQAVTYLASFQAVLKEAVRHVRDAGIRPKIERIFNIWEERSVYSSDFIADLKELITSSPKSSAERDSKAAPSYKPSPMAATNSSSSATASSSASSSKPATDPKPVVDPKLVADFKPMELRDKIQELSVLEMEVELKRNQLQLCKLDLTNTEAVRQLKDRAHGKEFSRQVEESSSRLEEYVLSLGRLAQARKSLKQILQVSSVFYAEQFHEVKIVAHAYKNFGSRVGNVKKKLGELVQSLPDPLSPIPSPNVDAPSPGNTPPLEPDKDTETVDMELSEEEEPAETIISPPAGRVAFTTTTKSISKPIASIREFRVEGTSEQAVEEAVEDKHKGRHHHSHHSKRKSSPEDSLEKRIADMLPNLPGEARKEKEHRHRRKSRDDKGGHKMKSVVAKVIYNSPKASQQYSPLEEGGGTPLADERPSTPVQDEKSPAASASQKVNPIDFLSQLISNTQKSGVASATNSSFLTQLTSTMGASREQQNGVEEDPAASGPQNWSSWKRDNQPELPPPPVSMTLPPRPILPPSGMVLPPTMRPVMGVAPPSPELLPPPAPPANFGGPPPRGPGLGMPPRFPDFSQPPPAPFFPQTSPGQKENWPLTGTGPPTSLPTPMQSVPIILGSNHPPPRSSPSDISPRGMLSPQGTTSPLPSLHPPPLPSPSRASCATLVTTRC